MKSRRVSPGIEIGFRHDGGRLGNIDQHRAGIAKECAKSCRGLFRHLSLLPRHRRVQHMTKSEMNETQHSTNAFCFVTAMMQPSRSWAIAPLIHAQCSERKANEDESIKHAAARLASWHAWNNHELKLDDHMKCAGAEHGELAAHGETAQLAYMEPLPAAAMKPMLAQTCIRRSCSFGRRLC